MTAAVPVYMAYNDSHWNVHKYQIDSQAPENTSHFAMRITLFSPLVLVPMHVGGATLQMVEVSKALPITYGLHARLCICF